MNIENYTQSVWFPLWLAYSREEFSSLLQSEVISSVVGLRYSVSEEDKNNNTFPALVVTN